MKRAFAVLLVVGTACPGSPVQGRMVIEPGDGTLTYSSTPVGYSGDDQFTWKNTAAAAAVSFRKTALTEGTVQVTMTDPVGQVALRTVDDGGAVPAAYGKAGEWTIDVSYSNATGTVVMAVTPE